MILICTECKARFLVADSLIPQEGRTVRCGSCGNQWHVDKPDEPPAFHDVLEEVSATPQHAEDDDALDAMLSSPAISNVPVVSKKPLPVRPFKIAAAVLLVLWALLAFFTYFPAGVNTPVLGSIYSLFGVRTTTGLVFVDVKMERVEEGPKTRFIVSGKIVNRAAEDRTVPVVNVALKDAEGDDVFGRSYDVDIHLKPGEEYPFRIVNVETSFAQNVKTITLDLGNSLELMSR